MSQVSSQYIDNKVKRKIERLFSYCIKQCRDDNTVAEFVDDLLTPTEKIMLAKRVAIALMILKKNTYEEIKNMLQPKIEDVKIEIGDIVEMIAEPFKNEKAKVTRIDRQKGEVVVSLLGASVPIPVTVKLDNVKVIRRDDKAQEEDKGDEEMSQESKEDDYGI